ncbi:MAG: hypothetical protein KAX05_02825 [Bacteroidales bacterium]|nr:hypothetical protein [Bacteroidales bacterium]
MEEYISKLDTERFGFKIAKVNHFSEDPSKIISNLAKHGVKLVISRIESENIILLNQLENLGFLLKDCQVTYKYDLTRTELPSFKINPIIKIRKASLEDTDALTNIAMESFYYYGHYFADNKLNKDKCLEIYKDWTQRSCSDRNVADIIFLAEINNNITGYLGFKIFQTRKGDYAAGVLGAVTKNFRKMGVFQAVTVEGLKWGKVNNLLWEEHNVLITNYSVNNTFSTIGFKLLNSYYTLHLWIQPVTSYDSI